MNILKSPTVSGEIFPLSMEFVKSCFKKNYKAATYKQINILNIDNDTDCLGDEITSNKKKIQIFTKIVILFF